MHQIKGLTEQQSWIVKNGATKIYRMVKWEQEVSKRLDGVISTPDWETELENDPETSGWYDISHTGTVKGVTIEFSLRLYPDSDGGGHLASNVSVQVVIPGEEEILDYPYDSIDW